jgi:phage/plasmid-like protein (TIGR03299 family)
MGHQIEANDAMVSVEVPWHGLGVRLPKKATADELRKLVFPWMAVEAKIRMDGGEIIETHRAVVRSDDHTLLSVMPKTYEVVQYQDALALLESAAKAGEAVYESAGTLAGGKRAWALTSIPSMTFDVAGSEMKPYLMMSTAHDGSRAVRCLFTPVYVVCANTETAALNMAGVATGKRQVGKAVHNPNVITIAHTANANERVKGAAYVMAQARQYFGVFNEVALKLVAKKMSDPEFDKFILAVEPVIEARPNAGRRMRESITYLYKEGKHRAALCAPNTAWCAYNAVTEYIDHQRGLSRTPEGRFESALFGSGASVKQRAMDYLLAA